MSSWIPLAVLVLAMPLAQCQMNMDMDTVAYNATVFSNDPNPGSTVFSGYLDKETYTFYWNFNFTKPGGVTGLQSLEIRDGKPGMDILGKELQVFPTPFTGARAFSGNFSDGINPAVASNATELANHMCMGHIYAVINTENGPQRAAIKYNPKGTGIAECYAAVGLEGSGMESMPMDMNKDMVDAPVAVNSAETRSIWVGAIVVLTAVVAVVL